MPARTPERTRAIVVVLFFLSGISSLVYQVIWVRQLGTAFGNTIHSAALVTGVFMAGLGAGSYVLGRYGDRRYRSDPRHPLRTYAWVELAIAALGLLLAIGLPRLGALAAAMSGYERGANGWYEISSLAYLLRYLVAIVLIAPPTFLMGGTLTLLIRFCVASDLSSAGYRIGLLYGANTAGAALGALLTDFVLVPRFGVSATQVLAVALNAAAGAGALSLSSRPAQQELAPSVLQPSERGPSPDAAANKSRRSELGLAGATLCLSGFAAMGLEILWFRFASGILGGRRAVFSLLLAVILVGIWIGSMVGGVLHRRFGRPIVLLLCSQSLLAGSALALLGLLDHQGMFRSHVAALRTALGPSLAPAPMGMELWSLLRPIVIVTALPAILMGCAFPLANAVVQRAQEAVGRRAGVLYAANTSGNVLGSAGVGFVLIPAIGIQRTALLLAACALASVVPLLFLRDLRVEVRSARVGRVALVGALGLGSAAVAGFLQLPRGWMLRPNIPPDDGGTRRVLAVSEGPNETIVVAEVRGLDTQLFTNGHSMSSTHPKSQRYMRAFSHLPLLQMDAPRRVLVICFGVGTTANAASLHPSVERLEVADLSRHVLEHAHYFEASNHGILTDPRVSVFVNDGRHHLLMQPRGSYDLVTLEPPPISFAGVAALYSREFYALVRDRLRPGGFMTQWLPGYQVGGDMVLSLVRAFIEVFPESVLLSGYDNELILMGTTGPSIEMDIDAVAGRLRAAPAVQADLERIDLGSLTELAGMFAASYRTMAAATTGSPPVTDDRPILEYSVRSDLRARRLPRELFDVTDSDAWCPGCRARLLGLDAYLRLRGRIYATEWFLLNDDAAAPALDLPTDADAMSTVVTSPYLQALYGGQAHVARKMALQHIEEGDVEGAIGASARAIALDSGSASAHSALGRAYALRGKVDAAAFELERAVNLAPNDAATRVEFAGVLRKLGEARGAVEQYRAGLALDPYDCAARYDLGVVLQGLGLREEAEEELRAILALEPWHPRANLVLCKREVAQGRFERAVAYCDIAAEGGVELPAELVEILWPYWTAL